MEENKVNSQESNKQENKKLSYEQLEAYASQTTMRAKEALRELNMLRYNTNLSEISIAIKCIEMSDKFSKEFISKLTKKIEEAMLPEEPEENNKEK